MSFLDKLFGRDYDDNRFEYEDDYYEPETDVMRQPPNVNPAGKSGRVLNLSSNNPHPGGNQQMIEIVEPQSMETMWQICDYVREGKTVICNIEGISAEHRQRLVDFVTGAAYAMDGEIQPVSQLIFVFTPRTTRIGRDGYSTDDYAFASDEYMRNARVFAR